MPQEDGLVRCLSRCVVRTGVLIARAPAIVPSNHLVLGLSLAHRLGRCTSYRLHDTTGDDLGTVEDPAPNVEPGDVIVLADGRRLD